MSIVRRLTGGGGEARGLVDLLAGLGYFTTSNGQSYPIGLNQTMPGESQEAIENSFTGYVQGIYKAHGAVAACMVARRHVFGQIRYQWQEMSEGVPGRLAGNTNLGVLERPWLGATTADLNRRMIDLADLGGQAYVTINRAGNLKVIRPDWVTMIIGLEDAPDTTADVAGDLEATLLGYMYEPPNRKPILLDPDKVAHFAPRPDPLAQYRGMSWLTPVLRNIQSHQAATVHKEKFFTNGATPNMVVSWDKAVSEEKVKAFKALFLDKFQGLENAYKTMFLGGGADVEVVGQDFKQLDFKTVQGTDETLIAANAGVPAVIAGLSEGLANATYSNYGQAKKQFGETTIYDLGQDAAGSLEILVPRQSDQRLWFTTDTPFFRDDAKAEADVRFRDATTYRQLLDAGATPESAKQYLLSGDPNDLEHSGLFSVQLQKPGGQTQQVSAASLPELMRQIDAARNDGWEIDNNDPMMTAAGQEQ